MHFFKLLFILTLKLSVVLTKNLAIVVDTTVSMNEEINLLKNHIGYILDDVSIIRTIEKYVLVTFDGRDLTSLTTTNSSALKRAVHSLAARTESACAENSMTALESALGLSQSDSYVFLFTDAYAKDEGKHDSIVNFCRTTNSKVNILLSGECSPNLIRSEGSIDVYYDVTRACSGTVFQLEPNHYRQVLKFMADMMKAEWSKIITHDHFTGNKEFVFSAGTFASDAVIVASGEQMTLEILDEDERKPTVTKLLDTKNAQVLRISQPKNDYKITIRSQGRSAVTFYSKFIFPFKYGFSSLVPRNIKETSLRPIAGRNNFITIEVSRHHNLKPQKIDVVSDSVNAATSLEYRNATNIYTAEYFFEPNKPFKLVVTASDNTNYKDVVLTSSLIEAQTTERRFRWMQPYVEIIDEQTTIVKYGTNAKLACKVIGYPKPEIWWESTNGNILPSEAVLLILPSTYISYVNIENAVLNDTITCKSKNSEGEYHQDMQLFTRREYKFVILQAPQNESVEYGTEKTIYCKIDAYPEANITWYHNKTMIEYSDNVVINGFGELVIRNMGLDEVGEYECEFRNDMKTERYSGILSLSGLEEPKLSLTSSNIIVQPGEDSKIECSATGKPNPLLSWKYKPEEAFEFSDIPIDVNVENSKLIIKNAEPKHSGTYRCVGINIKGESFADVLFEVHYAPFIDEIGQTQLAVKEGDEVELPCKVRGIPKPSVRWELIQVDAVVPFDTRHQTDNKNTHRFVALWKDSGSYNCVAENTVGKAETTVNVTVHVAPYIRPPFSKVVTVKEGGSVILQCEVLVGYPAPTTQWEFIATNSTSFIISRHQDSRNPLKLDYISRSQEGYYVCSAENEIGTCTIRIRLEVK